MGEAETSNCSEGLSQQEYEVLEQPLGTPRHIRIITIGAGASGLNMVRTLRKHLKNFEHVVYDKNPDIGGTWYENRYPRCKCDIPSHNYQFSWRPNPEWPAFYSSHDEIHGYLKRLCDEEHLWDSIRLSHRVTRAEWNEDEGKWHLHIKDVTTDAVINDHCDFLLDASGILKIGDLVHTARWPENFEYHGKTVAVIGNGSSGVQIVPELQPAVQKLVHFIRSPTWVVPPGMQIMNASSAGNVIRSLDMEDDRFSKAQIERFKENPKEYREFVKATEEAVNSKPNTLLIGTPEASITKQRVAGYMRQALQYNESLTEALIPDFPIGCRRITPAVGYLEPLTKENVQVITDGIAEIVPNGLRIVTGEHIKVDAIVCATGFDVSFCPRFPIIGRKGNLQDNWKEDLPSAYMSCAVPDTPNYFQFLGPNAPIGHGSAFTITEHVAKYILKIIQKCQTQGIKSVSPKHIAVKQFSEHIDKFMPRTAWAGTCRSWFKNGLEAGPVTALHPGSRLHWFHMLEEFRGEDFEYKYFSSNMFCYLGNGFSTRESNGQNTTWYLDEPDKLF